MSSGNLHLHIFFFPFMAHGHMIPMVDMAKLFAMRGVKATIVTTPLNEPFVSRMIERAKTRGGVMVDILTIELPVEKAGLPEGCENVDLLTSDEMRNNFIIATRLLQQPLEQLLHDYHVDCLISDLFFPWTTNAAAKFSIPRLIFQVTSFFSMSAFETVQRYEPHKKVTSDSEPFLIPNFPGEIKLTRMQLPDFTTQEVETEFKKLFNEVAAAELCSNGTVVNSFYELEPVYVDHYRKVLGKRAWHLGPVSLCNKEVDDKAQRGKEASIGEHECLKWLDAKKTNSVVYVCFGSLANFSDSQLMEIAMGLESSGQQFIWVVRKGKNEKEEED